MDTVLSTVMFLTVIFADPEGDGSYNYLLERKNGAVDRQYSIAHSYSGDMGLKPGDSFYAEVKGTCSLVWALDPVPQILQGTLPWGLPRRSYVCNANSIVIEGKEYRSLIRSNNE
jgi:hypothetical protein